MIVWGHFSQIFTLLLMYIPKYILIIPIVLLADNSCVSLMRVMEGWHLPSFVFPPTSCQVGTFILFLNIEQYYLLFKKKLSVICFSNIDPFIEPCTNANVCNFAVNPKLNLSGPLFFFMGKRRMSCFTNKYFPQV